MEKGWIKLYRSSLENTFLMHDNNAYIVFTKLLMLVGQEKGQWSGGRHQLSEITNINSNTLKDVLKRLENNGMISTESAVRYSIITIKNWGNYQYKPNGGQQRKTPRKTPLAQQRSLEYNTPDLTPTRHHGDTTATPARHHSIKNKNKEKEIEGIEILGEENDNRASPEAVAKAREKLMEKLRNKP